jgi:enoyl-CoA hydratase/carnithine racemase
VNAAENTRFGPVTVSTEGGVATVVVDSPPVNAMGDAVLDGLGAAARRIGEAAGRVRVVVLTGAGTKAFMASADIAEFAALRDDADGIAAHARTARAVFDAWRALPQPLVAAVQASAVGGGLEIAMVCDLIVSDPAARFGLPEVTLGLIPGAGGTQLLPTRIGAGPAKELLLLGSVIDAGRAHALGLVNRVTEPGAALVEAQRLADRIAALPWVAVSAIKRAIDGEPDEFDAQLDRERELFLRAAASADFREGISAFLGKRRASFRHC